MAGRGGDKQSRTEDRFGREATERRQLGDAETVTRWLEDHPGVEVISRDRAAAYAKAASEGAPEATQVADRWHLLKNLREAVEALFRRCHSDVQEALRQPDADSSDELTEDATPERNPDVTGEAKKETEDPPSHRRDQFDRVHQLHTEGVSIREISRRLGISRHAVRRYLRSGRLPDWGAGEQRASRLDAHQKWIDRQLSEGRINATDIHRELNGRGVKVSSSAVRRYVARRLEALGISRPRATRTTTQKRKEPKIPTPRRLSFDFIRRPQKRGEQAQARLDAIHTTEGRLSNGLAIAEQFAELIRGQARESLSDWITAATNSEVPELRTFAEGIERESASIEAATTEHWSNGPVEGSVGKLKMIKRQMFGRAGMDLLRARVVNSV